MRHLKPCSLGVIFSIILCPTCVSYSATTQISVLSTVPNALVIAEAHIEKPTASPDAIPSLPVVDSVRQNYPQKPSTVAGIDLFGTSQITTEQVRQAWGEKIKQFCELVFNRSNSDPKQIEKLYKEITNGIHSMGDFAFVGVSPVMYYRDGNPLYVTIDVVEKNEATTRMQFLPKPTKTFTGLDRLFQQWAEYEQVSNELARAGELKNAFKVCPALHCTFGFEHPKLQKFEPIFTTGASRNRDQLIRILREDKDETHRAYAVFLLAHTNDVAKYVKLITPSIADSNSLVRNNVLRALIQITKDYPPAKIPINSVLQALHYPDTTDRNKAAHVLLELANRNQYRKFLIKQAVPVLLEMLKLQQPNNHDPAYQLLTTLSGQQYGARDYTAWEQWAAQAARLTL